MLTLRQAISFTLIVLMLAACSSPDEKDKAPAQENSTDKIAQEAIMAIKTPIENAKLAKELIEQHNAAVEKSAESK